LRRQWIPQCFLSGMSDPLPTDICDWVCSPNKIHSCSSGILLEEALQSDRSIQSTNLQTCTVHRQNSKEQDPGSERGMQTCCICCIHEFPSSHSNKAESSNHTYPSQHKYRSEQHCRNDIFGVRDSSCRLYFLYNLSTLSQCTGCNMARSRSCKNSKMDIRCWQPRPHNCCFLQM